MHTQAALDFKLNLDLILRKDQFQIWIVLWGVSGGGCPQKLLMTPRQQLYLTNG